VKKIGAFVETRGVGYQHPLTADESIALVDVWKMIVRRKRIVLVSFLLSMILATAYLFVAEPVYRATVQLLPPNQADIQGLMPGFHAINGGIEHYTPKQVYSVFLATLESQGLRREFFDNHKLASHFVPQGGDTKSNVDEIFDTRFNDNIQIQLIQEGANSPSFAAISLRWNDPELAAIWLNKFVDFANKRIVRQLASDVQALISSEIAQIDQQLASKLKFAELRRTDAIKELREALQIARALDLKDISATKGLSDQSGVVISVTQLPLYMRGIKALEKEIAALESRESDAPFIDGLRDLEERRFILENISLDSSSVSAVTADSPARIPYRVEKPKKVMVMIFAALFGIILGVLLILIVDFSASVRQQLN